MNGLGVTKLFEMPSLRKVAEFHVSTGSGNTLAFSPDGSRLAIGTSDGLKVWDPEIQQELLELDCSFTYQCEFSPDGNFLVVRTFQGKLNIWNAPSWTKIESRSTTRKIAPQATK